MNQQNYAPGTLPDLPPPSGTVGPIHWLRKNLFSSAASSIVTLIAIYFLYLALPSAFSWLFLDATYVGQSRKDCAPDGACLAFIVERFNLFVYGFYPVEQRWRVNLATVLLAVAGAGNHHSGLQLSGFWRDGT